MVVETTASSIRDHHKIGVTGNTSKIEQRQTKIVMKNITILKPGRTSTNNSHIANADEELGVSINAHRSAKLIEVNVKF